MSCSDIKVTIVGDVAGVSSLVQQASQYAVAAKNEADRAKNEADRAASEVANIGILTPNLVTGHEGVVLASKTKAYNFKGAGVKVTQTATGEFDIVISGDDGDIKINDVAGLKAALDELKSNKIDEVTGSVDAADKVVTLQMKSGGQVIKTNKIDLLPMFAKTAPSPHSIYYGFSASNTLVETTIKQGQKQNERAIKAVDLTLTRSDSDQKYMYVWVPDVFGDVVGFKFSGTFTDVWQSSAVTVGGVAGKVYVSDNPTSAKSVSFEVEQ